MAWSRNAEKCVGCGTVLIPHRARGMCGQCLDKWYDQRIKAHLDKDKARWDKHFEAYKEYVEKTGQQPPWKFTRYKGVSIGKWLYREILPRKNYLSIEQKSLLDELGLDWNLIQCPDTISKKLTKPTFSTPSQSPKPPRGAPSCEELRTDYIDKAMSLADMGKKYNFTRQYILTLLKFHGIPRRSQQEARWQAIDQGKLSSLRLNDLGEKETVVHVNRFANEDFFKTWSPAMAYVLGVLYSDGCIAPSKDREERETHKNKSFVCTISVSQKEPELLEKLLVLMESNALLAYQPKRGIAGAIYTIAIRSNTMYDDLLHLGLTPRKSRTIAFPRMPHEYVRHFIRGCWDGDGSIYFEGNNPLKPRAHYVSGSRDFVEGLVQQLHKEGLTKATVHSKKGAHSFYVKYGPKDCAKLFSLFYNGVDETMFLNRKYERFFLIGLGTHYLKRACPHPTLNNERIKGPTP